MFEREVAKGATFSVLLLMRIALVVLGVVLVWYLGGAILSSRDELRDLRRFKAETDRAEGISAAQGVSFEGVRAEAATQGGVLQDVYQRHESHTQEAAHVDPSSADWLDGRIPERLRDADRAARESR